MKNNFDSSLLKRSERINFLYKYYLLLPNDLDLLELDENFSKEQKEFIELTISKREELETEIKKFVDKSWTFERFHNIEKAILLNAFSEIIFKNNKKNIVINESVEYAKKYCDVKTPGLINAIIDKIEIK